VFKQKLELVILEPHTTFGDHRSVRVRTVFPRVPNTIIVHLFETFVGVSFASKILELDTTAPVSERRSLDEMLLGVPRKCIHHPAVEGDDDPVEDVKVVIVEDIRRKTRINESPEEEADGVEDDYEPDDDQDDHKDDLEELLDPFPEVVDDPFPHVAHDALEIFVCHDFKILMAFLSPSE